MARKKTAENAKDPATGRLLPRGVVYRGPAQYRARKMFDGSRVTRTFETARLAREWLEETSVAARKGELPDSPAAELKGMTVADLVALYETEVIRSPRRRGGKEDLGHLPSLRAAPLGTVALPELKPEHVRAFAAAQEAAEFAPATWVKRLNILSAMWTWAKSQKGMPLPGENPARAGAVARPKGADKRRDRVLMDKPHPQDLEDLGMTPTAEQLADLRPELDLLLDAMRSETHPRDIDLVRFALAQGMRLGEACALEWGDVSFRKATVTVHGRRRTGEWGRGRDGSKNDSHREVKRAEVRPLTPGALQLLRDLRPASFKATDSVFGIEVAAFKVRFGRLRDRAQARLPAWARRLGFLADLRFHDLRHVATTNLSSVFSDPRERMAVTGHLDQRSMNRYYHPDPEELARRMAAQREQEQEEAARQAKVAAHAKAAQAFAEGRIDADELRRIISKSTGAI